MDGSEMLRFMSWAQGVLTLDPAAPSAIKDVALVYKLHIVLGLTLFVITPFTRLVHVWSAPIWFLLRPGYQIVRSRSSKKRAYSLTQGPVGGAPSYGGTTVLRQMSESRSEEHTSELKSLMRISYAVFCLKKKAQMNRQLSIDLNFNN